MSNVPKSTDYSRVKPVGIPSSLRITKFQPQSAYGNLSSTDTIRFLINAPGYWDPYRTYLNINVDCSAMGTGYFQQLDSSAHSFFQELVIYCKGTEIERIMEYDTLAAILNDVHYTPEQRQSRGHEGLGFSARANPPPDYGKASGGNYWGRYTPNQVADSYFITGNVGARAICQANVGTYNSIQSGTTNPAMYQNSTFHDTVNTNGDNVSLSFFSQLPFNLAAATMKTGPNGMNIPLNTPQWYMSGIERADVVLMNNTSYTMHEVDGLANNLPVTSSFNGVGYNTSYNEDACDVGCSNLFNYSLCGGSFEPRFSYFQQKSTINGRLGQMSQILKGSFSIPLISGLFGILMPSESFKIMPMQAFEDLILEFRLSRYAMFTSGYTDGGIVNQFGIQTAMSAVTPFNTTQSNMPNRTFAITKLEIVTELIEFDSPEIDVIVNNQLESGIVFHSNSWYNGPSFELNNTAAASGTFQVNLGFESLKTLMFCFLSSDYRAYSFCRKQYRLSRNINWLQIRIGVDYYPSQAIEGNSGDAHGITSNGGNNEFLINLFKAFGKLHDIMGDHFVSVYNFAVNERPYDITDTRPFLNLAANGGAGQIQNKSTSMGMPGYYENACVGKAVYAINLESLNNDLQYISGVNTIKNRPFDINIKSSIYNVNSLLDRPATMVTFCLYDFLLEVTKTRIRVIGRG